MPEKRFGMKQLFKNVFKSKKNSGDDIVCQAEQVIADYISNKRNEIITKYTGKSHRFLNFSIFVFSGALLYFLYTIFK